MNESAAGCTRQGRTRGTIKIRDERVWGVYTHADAHLTGPTVTVLAAAWDRGGAWRSGVAYKLGCVVRLGSVFGLENRTHKLFPGH